MYVYYSCIQKRVHAKDRRETQRRLLSDPRGCRRESLICDEIRRYVRERGVGSPGKTEKRSLLHGATVGESCCWLLNATSKIYLCRPRAKANNSGFFNSLTKTSLKCCVKSYGSRKKFPKNGPLEKRSRIKNPRNNGPPEKRSRIKIHAKMVPRKKGPG